MSHPILTHHIVGPPLGISAYSYKLQPRRVRAILKSQCSTMSSVWTILRTFLASPGDLREERQAVRDAVDEFNDSWADELGYQIELLGWEDTTAGFGRPQHLINRDGERCDLFIGMIWKKWGTQPNHDGTFSSGFHEEFERSKDRRKHGDSPEICLSFKKIPDDFTLDPGENLKRVLDCKKTIVEGKQFLFQNFSTVQDMALLARKCITEYVIQVKKKAAWHAPDEVRAERAKSEPEETAGQNKDRKSSPLSDKSFGFLEDLVGKISQKRAMDDISASDVARLRLLANSIAKPGNEAMASGVHDVNILFRLAPTGWSWVKERPVASRGWASSTSVTKTYRSGAGISTCRMIELR